MSDLDDRVSHNRRSKSNEKYRFETEASGDRSFKTQKHQTQPKISQWNKRLYYEYGYIDYIN